MGARQAPYQLTHTPARNVSLEGREWPPHTGCLLWALCCSVPEKHIQGDPNFYSLTHRGPQPTTPGIGSTPQRLYDLFPS